MRLLRLITSQKGGRLLAVLTGAWGYTYAKPEISAPGRYMVGPVPDGSTLATTRPDYLVAPGYEELSGTTFAADVPSYQP